MIGGRPVYVSGKSRYAFTPLSFVGQWIVKNLNKSGVIEVGARNTISLEDLARQLDLKSTFEGSEDHQEIITQELSYPDVNLVLDFMKEKKKESHG